MQHYRWIILILILMTLPLAACAGKAAKTAHHEPAKIEPVPGSKLKRVTLTEKAAQRLALETAPVREEHVARTRQVGGQISEPASPTLVRVSLIDSELKVVDKDQPTTILPLGSKTGVKAQPARPPSAQAAQTGALYYAVDGTGHNFKPGQRVLVNLPLVGGGTKKVVPYAAVIYDLHGEQWVYTNVAPLTFVRHAVNVDFIEGDRAVLVDGPPIGALVVTAGVAELWGAETGVGGGGH
jgi:hypothetical protein